VAIADVAITDGGVAAVSTTNEGLFCESTAAGAICVSSKAVFSIVAGKPYRISVFHSGYGRATRHCTVEPDTTGTETHGRAANQRDVVLICLAITESGELDAQTDAALHAAAVSTAKGKALAAKLQEGDVLPDDGMYELVEWIRATNAREDSLDCRLIEDLWSLGE